VKELSKSLISPHLWQLTTKIQRGHFLISDIEMELEIKENN